MSIKRITYKLLEKSDILFLFLLLSFSFLNIFSSNLTRSLEHPIFSVYINIIYSAVYFAILYFVGFNVSNILHGLFKTKESINDLAIIDYILIGIITIICIGIIGGILGILTFWYYGIFVLFIAVISKNYKTQIHPSIQFSWNWIFLACIIIIFVIFSIFDLMASLEINQPRIGFIVEYVHQLKAIIHHKCLMATPFASEGKVDQKYYAYLMDLPALLPSFIQSIPYINVGMVIFSVLVIFYGFLRIFSYRNIAVLSASLFTLLIISSLIVPNAFDSLKTNNIFLLLFYTVTFIYILLFTINNNRTYFWIAVISTGLLSGETILGAGLASATVLIIFILYYKKQILSRTFFKAIIIIALLFSLPIIINYYLTGLKMDVTSNYIMKGLGIEYDIGTLIHQEYYSNLDHYLKNDCYNKYQYSQPKIRQELIRLKQESKRHTIGHKIKVLIFMWLLPVLLDYGGIFFIISIILILIFQYKKPITPFFIIYNLQILILAYFNFKIDDTYISVTFPGLVLASSQILFTVTVILKKSDIFQSLDQSMQRKMINYIFVLLFSLVISIYPQVIYAAAQLTLNIETMSNFDSKGDYISNNSNNLSYSFIRFLNNISCESGLTQIEHYKNFIHSESYAKIKSYFKPKEFVFEFDYRDAESYYRYISDVYDLTPIYYTNILNNALYSDKPENVISTLKKLNVRYILLVNNPIYECKLPKPTLFEKKYGGRFLKIVDTTPLLDADISPIWFSKMGSIKNMRDSLVLLEVLYEESPTDNIELMNIIDKLKFNEDPKLRAVLSTDVLTDEIIERMKNFYR